MSSTALLLIGIFGASWALQMHQGCDIMVRQVETVFCSLACYYNTTRYFTSTVNSLMPNRRVTYVQEFNDSRRRHRCAKFAPGRENQPL